MAVDGRIQVRTYDDKEGQRRWVTEVVGDNVRFLSPKGEQPSSTGQESGESHGIKGEELNITEDDVPF